MPLNQPKYVKSVCIFCGSRSGRDPVHKNAAIELGQLLAKNRIRLVYGGGHVGLMGIIADEVLTNGGHVTGVIPEFLERLEVGHNGLTEKIETNSMHVRKQRMFDLSDAFISMPGGLGTLDETFEIITWKQLRLHNKPIIIMDNCGYWQPLEALIQSTINDGFADPQATQLYSIVDGPDQALKALEINTSHPETFAAETAKPERF